LPMIARAAHAEGYHACPLSAPCQLQSPGGAGASKTEPRKSSIERCSRDGIRKSLQVAASEDVGLDQRAFDASVLRFRPRSVPPCASASLPALSTSCA
jgi:hypothetical protein